MLKGLQALKGNCVFKAFENLHPSCVRKFLMASYTKLSQLLCHKTALEMLPPGEQKISVPLPRSEPLGFAVQKEIRVLGHSEYLLWTVTLNCPLDRLLSLHAVSVFS